MLDERQFALLSDNASSKFFPSRSYTENELRIAQKPAINRPTFVTFDIVSCYRIRGTSQLLHTNHVNADFEE